MQVHLNNVYLQMVNLINYLYQLQHDLNVIKYFKLFLIIFMNFSLIEYYLYKTNNLLILI